MPEIDEVPRRQRKLLCGFHTCCKESEGTLLDLIHALNMNIFQLFPSILINSSYVFSPFPLNSWTEVLVPEVQRPLPSRELIEEVVTIATKEPQLGLSEEQSHTFMIEGVREELAPEVEATAGRGNGEEEGSSYTPGKNDNKGNDVNDADQIIGATDQQAEAQYEEAVHNWGLGECPGRGS